MEETEKEKLNAIYLEVIGQPEFNRKGMRKQLDDNTTAINNLSDRVEKLEDEIKKRPFPLRWTLIGTGGGATGGYFLSKTTVGKALAAFGAWLVGK